MGNIPVNPAMTVECQYVPKSEHAAYDVIRVGRNGRDLKFRVVLTERDGGARHEFHSELYSSHDMREGIFGEMRKYCLLTFVAAPPAVPQNRPRATRIFSLTPPNPCGRDSPLVLGNTYSDGHNHYRAVKCGDERVSFVCGGEVYVIVVKDSAHITCRKQSDFVTYTKIDTSRG